jgi:glycosyltransferase involved in cell wall biosynthesis
MKTFFSIILGSYNRLSFLKLTIESIRKEQQALSSALNSEIIVVDGGSDDGSLEWLSEQKDIIPVVQHNRGTWQGKEIERRSWGYFMNLAFKCAQGKYICMISDDSLLVPGSLKNGIEQFERELGQGNKVGAMAFYWRNWPEQKEYHVGNPFNSHMYVNHGLYLKQALEEIDFIDEENYSFYFADIDLCFRLWRKGYQCIDAQSSYVEHYSHANFDVRKKNSLVAEKDHEAFIKRWQSKIPNFNRRFLGEVKKKYFKDKNKTAQQFLLLHKKILKSNKEIRNKYSLKNKMSKKYLNLKNKVKDFMT